MSALRSFNEVGHQVYTWLVYYVYILKSQKDPTQTYIGYTEDLKQRFKAHNSGSVLHTKKFIPWKLETYTAFSDKYLALKFEKYLKVGSGKAFLNKRLTNNL